MESPGLSKATSVIGPTTRSEAEKQERAIALDAYQKREAEKERAGIEHLWGRRLGVALEFEPPKRFAPDFIGVGVDGKLIMEYGATFEGFRSNLQPKAFKAAKNLALGVLEKGLLLIGPVGVGKTHLASAIFNQRLANWLAQSGLYGPSFRTRFITENALLGAVRATFKQDSDETEDELLAGFAGCRLLIIDDLCKYEAADPRFRNRILFEVIDRLWSGDGALVATSNYGLPELTQMLGEPIVDRVRDMCVVAEMTGKSQRGRGG